MGLIPMMLDWRNARREFSTLKELHLQKEREDARKRAEAQQAREMAALDSWPTLTTKGADNNDFSAYTPRLPNAGSGFSMNVPMPDYENAYVGVPAIAATAQPAAGSQVLQQIRDRMAKTRDRMSGMRGDLVKGLRDPFMEYPQLQAAVANNSVEYEEYAPRTFFQQNRPRYV
jgi:hypothetical protein